MTISAESHRISWSDVAMTSLLALLFVLVGLTEKSIWLDEAVSIDLARTGIRDMLPTFAGDDPNMALYYLGLNFWRRLFGEGEFAMRAPSVISAALAAGAITALGQRLFTRDVGRLAGVLLALHAMTLSWGQLARGYTFVALLSVLCMWAFVAELERPSTRNRALWVMTGVALVYLHYLAALLLVAQGVYVIALRGRPLQIRQRLWAAAVIGMCCLPAAIAARRGGTARIDWVQPLSADVVSWLFTMFGSHSLPVFCVLLTIAIAGSVFAWRTSRATPAATEREVNAVSARLLVALWFTVPIGATLVLSTVRPLLLPHYVFAALPGFLLWAASSLTVLRSARMRLLVTAILAAAVIPGTFWVRREGYREDWRSAVTTILRDRAIGNPDSVLILTTPPYASRPLNYYLRRAGYEDLVPWTVPSDYPLPPRVWYGLRIDDLESHRAILDSTRARLERTHKLRARHHFSRVAVELYER